MGRRDTASLRAGSRRAPVSFETGFEQVRRATNLLAMAIGLPDLRPRYRLGTRSGIGRLKVEAPMRSGPVVVLDVRAKEALQMALPEHNDVVETLSSNEPTHRSANAFALGARTGVFHRRESFRSEHFIDGT
jgi:hypothetical protein